MERELTGGRGGGEKEREDPTRNGGVEEAGSFKKNGPILYFPRNEHIRIGFSGSIAGQFHSVCYRHILIYNSHVLKPT